MNNFMKRRRRNESGVTGHSGEALLRRGNNGRSKLHHGNAPVQLTIEYKQKGESIMLKLHRIMKFLACLVLATSFMACASTRTHEGTGEYVDDTAITTKVKAAIFTDSDLKVMQINVETFKGVVQLSGFVNSRASATKAAEVARGIKGVVEVKNDLVVK